MAPVGEKKARLTELNPDHIHYGIITLALISPLVFFPSLINLYRLPKTTFITLLVTAMIWLWLFLLIQEKEQKPLFPLAVPILFYLGISALSLIKTTNPFEGIFALSQEVTYILLFWLVVNHVRTKEKIEIVLQWAIPTAVIVSLIGIYQIFGGRIPTHMDIGSPGSTFGNKNPAAQYILLTLPFSYLFLLTTKDRHKEQLFAICAATTTTYLIYTGTRAAWIGCFIALLAILIFLRSKKPLLEPEVAELKAKTLRKKVALGCIVFFVIAMNLIPSYLEIAPPVVTTRFSGALELSQDSSLQDRLAIWANTVEMFKDHPVLGVGKGNFKIVYPLYAARAIKEPAFSAEVQTREAHNDYVQLLGETGVLGLLSFLWMMLLIGSRVWKSIPAKKNDLHSILLILALSFSIFALLINASLDFPFELPISLSFFWLFSGLLWVSCENSRPVKAYRINSDWNPSPKLARIFLGLLSALSILFAAFHLNLLRAEFYFSRGTIWFYEIREGPSQPAESDLKTAQYLNPTSYRPPYLLGLLYIWEKRYDEAIKKNLEALKRHPYYINAYNNLGVAYASIGKTEEAEWAWRKALEIWPDHSEARNNLATVYAIEGKRAEAIALFKESLIRNPQDESAKQKLKSLLSRSPQTPVP